jgi:uncharacterized protein DUF3303
MPPLYTAPKAAQPAPSRSQKDRMLFLVISEPRPEPPSSVVHQRKLYWDWIAPLQASGEVRSVHAKVGRGAVVLFDVPSNERLHQRLNQWADIIPARFEVHALIDPAAALEFLGKSAAPEK